MTTIFNDFNIFNEITETFKRNIREFIVIDVQCGGAGADGKTLFAVTNDGDLYSYGCNRDGCLGLGHCDDVSEPQLVPELCRITVTEITNGVDFVYAVSDGQRIYGWGRNDHGQLGRDTVGSSVFKPINIAYFNDKHVSQVCCAAHYGLVLTAEGRVYLCGGDSGKSALISGANLHSPTGIMHMDFLPHVNLIQCSGNSCFALTRNGRVYSWGDNGRGILGHGERMAFVDFSIVYVSNVRDIHITHNYSYFQTYDTLYVFGGEGANHIGRVSPKETLELASIFQHTSTRVQMCAKSHNALYELKGEQMTKVTHSTFYQYYAKEWQITLDLIRVKCQQLVDSLIEGKLSKNLYEIIVALKQMTAKVVDNIHVVCDESGGHILFTTSDGQVYGLGSNYNACLGLTHNRCVEQPELLREICDEEIDEFFVGDNYVLAMTVSADKMFAWFKKPTGADESVFPLSAIEINTYYSGQVYKQVDCGSPSGPMLLTIDGILYQWQYKQMIKVAMRSLNDSLDESNARLIELDELNSSPDALKLIKITENDSFTINNIHCYKQILFTIADEKVFVCEENTSAMAVDGDQGGAHVCYDIKFSVDIPGVEKVACSDQHVYYLTKQGDIFISTCVNIDGHVKVTSDRKYTDMTAAMNSKYSKVIALSADGQVYELNGDSILETRFTSIDDYIIEELAYTHRTVHLPRTQVARGVINIDECIENVFAGHFFDHAEIGTGGFGTVYKARAHSDDKLYAIKKISTQGESKSIMRELKILRSLKHDSIVRLVAAWKEPGDHVYIQMELCMDNLNNIITMKMAAFGRRAVDKLMSTHEYFMSCELFVEIVEAVAYLHSQVPPVIHRDLKPANVLVNFPGSWINGRCLKLCDFGLATLHESESMSHTQDVGTLKYIPPEVTINRKYNQKADVYSLGIIAQELFDIDIHETIDQGVADSSPIGAKIAKLYRLIVDKMANLMPADRAPCTDILAFMADIRYSADDIGKDVSFINVPGTLREANYQMYKFIFIEKCSAIGVDMFDDWLYGRGEYSVDYK